MPFKILTNHSQTYRTNFNVVEPINLNVANVFKVLRIQLNIAEFFSYF